jgi:hypothetical protein
VQCSHEKYFVISVSCYINRGALAKIKSENCHYSKIVIAFIIMNLKGQSREIFDLLGFSSNNTPGSHDSWAKAVSNIDSF